MKNIKLDSDAHCLGSQPKIVSRQDWIESRTKLLQREKESLRLLDQISAERRQLPWVEIDKDYHFESPIGQLSLADLFAEHRQLVIYHFMFGPDWQEGCPSCSFVSDHFDGMLPHLAARDVAFVAVSRAPLPKIEGFKKRMGWKFKWVSSYDTDFNKDFHVSFSPDQMAKGKVDYNYALTEFPSAEAPGMSIFFKDDCDRIYHTYSTYSRGLEQIMSTYKILDMLPFGRNEEGLSFPMAWVRYHDSYGTDKFADADKPYWPETPTETSACSCGTAEARS